MKSFHQSPSMPVLVASSDDEEGSTSNYDSSSCDSSLTTNEDSSNAVASNNDKNPGIGRSASAFQFTEIEAGNSEETVVETAVAPHVGYKKVLVTGGAGFIGSNVAEYLLSRGDDVVIVDEMNDYYDVRIKESNIRLLQERYPEKGRVTFYRGDICDETLMKDIFETERPKWVCHMAARAGVRPSIQDPFVYIHSNIKGTTQLMELSHKYGVENFVFASSSSVYGGSKSTFFSEEENVDNPVSPYAASKKACELLAYTYHHLYQLNITGLRFFTVYGPRGRPDMAPFKFIDWVSTGKELKQFGDGSSSRDYTYISDIVDGVVRSIDRRHKYEVFNLGKGEGTSLKEFINLVQKHVGKKANIRILPDQPGDVPYTCADVTKAQRYLGYKSKIPFEEGIRRTAEWYKQTYGTATTISKTEEAESSTSIATAAPSASVVAVGE
jgi:UDP-glucuronate 4-epimerase